VTQTPSQKTSASLINYQRVNAKHNLVFSYTFDFTYINLHVDDDDKTYENIFVCKKFYFVESLVSWLSSQVFRGSGISTSCLQRLFISKRHFFCKDFRSSNDNEIINWNLILWRRKCDEVLMSDALQGIDAYGIEKIIQFYGFLVFDKVWIFWDFQRKNLIENFEEF
jgi:hypothetical protein